MAKALWGGVQMIVPKGRERGDVGSDVDSKHRGEPHHVAEQKKADEKELEETWFSGILEYQDTPSAMACEVQPRTGGRDSPAP